ncbi:hypothetical protein U0070_008622 [Myodes glareolus]|uniref:Uncharacterized protein n=1 Tax=Myodes glareolus TaxID=447135 RepID=A0AAW0JIE7_MYOGA
MKRKPVSCGTKRLVLTANRCLQAPLTGLAHLNARLSPDACRRPAESQEWWAMTAETLVWKTLWPPSLHSNHFLTRDVAMKTGDNSMTPAHHSRMMDGTVLHLGRETLSRETPSKGVMNNQRILLAYSLAVLLLQSVLLSIPSFCTSVAWMPINIMHNLAICVFLHTVKDSLPATLTQGSSVFDTLGTERLLLLPTFSSASLLFYSTHKAPYAPSTMLLASLSDCCLSVTYTMQVASPNTSTILTLPGQVHKTFLDVISHQLPEQAMFVLVQAAA